MDFLTTKNASKRAYLPISSEDVLKRVFTQILAVVGESPLALEPLS